MLRVCDGPASRRPDARIRHRYGRRRECLAVGPAIVGLYDRSPWRVSSDLRRDVPVPGGIPKVLPYLPISTGSGLESRNHPRVFASCANLVPHQCLVVLEVFVTDDAMNLSGAAPRTMTVTAMCIGRLTRNNGPCAVLVRIHACLTGHEHVLGLNTGQSSQAWQIPRSQSPTSTPTRWSRYGCPHLHVHVARQYSCVNARDVCSPTYVRPGSRNRCRTCR
jgi:hypothetical protein